MKWIEWHEKAMWPSEMKRIVRALPEDIVHWCRSKPNRFVKNYADNGNIETLSDEEILEDFIREWKCEVKEYPDE